jgi:hypothetical protein
MKLQNHHVLQALFLFALTLALAAGCKKEDDDNGQALCDQFNTSTLFISGNITGGDFRAMTSAGGGNWEYVVPQLDGTEIDFIIANTNDGKSVTWGDLASGTGNSALSGKAARKVEANGQNICGENRAFVYADDELRNKKITIKLDVNNEQYEIVIAESDACEEFGKTRMWVFWRLDDADPGSSGFQEMTEIQPGIFEIVKNNFQPCCPAWPVKFSNTNNWTQADWGREAGFSPTGNFDPLNRQAGRKVIDPVLENGIKVGEELICGGNGNIRIPTAGMEGKKIRLIFDVNKEEYTWLVEERDPCDDYTKNRMWVYWRTDDADAGSFGFEEMTQIQPGIFQIIRENFQPCCGAWPVKFVNSPDWTEADWGREQGFTPDPNFDPLNRKAGRKVIDPIFENGIKVGEDLICGGNSNIRFPTAGTEGKTIRLIFDANSEEYTWVTQ